MISQRLLRILIYLIALTTLTAAVSGCIVEDDDGEGDGGDDTDVDVDADDNDTDDDFGGANPTPYMAGPVRGTS